MEESARVVALNNVRTERNGMCSYLAHGAVGSHGPGDDSLWGAGAKPSGQKPLSRGGRVTVSHRASDASEMRGVVACPVSKSSAVEESKGVRVWLPLRFFRRGSVTHTRRARHSARSTLSARQCRPMVMVMCNWPVINPRLEKTSVKKNKKTYHHGRAHEFSDSLFTDKRYRTRRRSSLQLVFFGKLTHTSQAQQIFHHSIYKLLQV